MAWEGTICCFVLVELAWVACRVLFWRSQLSGVASDVPLAWVLEVTEITIVAVGVNGLSFVAEAWLERHYFGMFSFLPLAWVYSCFKKVDDFSC